MHPTIGLPYHETLRTRTISWFALSHACLFPYLGTGIGFHGVCKLGNRKTLLKPHVEWSIW